MGNRGRLWDCDAGERGEEKEIVKKMGKLPPACPMSEYLFQKESDLKLAVKQDMSSL